LEMERSMPYFAMGTVIKGFGRGSKELGIPTANFPETVVEKLPPALGTGVYYGLAKVDDCHLHKMVMSIGWNPYYKNEKKSMETHILHKFDEDFYGSQLRVAILGYIRPEENYSSLEELIKAIENDISVAKEKVDEQQLKTYSLHEFFRLPAKQLLAEGATDRFNVLTNGVQAESNGVQTPTAEKEPAKP